MVLWIVSCQGKPQTVEAWICILLGSVLLLSRPLVSLTTKGPGKKIPSSVEYVHPSLPAPRTSPLLNIKPFQRSSVPHQRNL